ncbi:MAG TPA: DUF192 domain-containing protein [Rhizorhapis sp.]
MRVILVSLIFLVTACNAAKPSTSDPAETEHQTKTIQLTIQSGTKVHTFDVEVARTPEEQAKGLMFRKELPAKGGMLFPFDPPQVASFWMKNTVIPLDIIFIRPDGSIAFIADKREPYSLIPVSSGQMNSAVLELAGGRAAALGIKKDDVVRWSEK